MIKILLVDDERGITESVKGFLEDRGFYVRTADSGEAAPELIEKDKPSIVFLDIRMPGMDGIETLRRIKAIDKNIRVIMLTVIDDKEIKDKAKALGADDYMTKPFSTERLEELLIKKAQELYNEKHKK